MSAPAEGGAPRPATQLRVLGADAVRDALRRRLVGFLVVLSMLSLLVVDSCTSCAGGSFQVDGREVDAGALLGAAGVVLYTTMLLWTVLLAGFLASDHLTQTLEDGSAALVLARPVGRGVFALARLAGSLVVSLTTGAVLLGATAAFLAARYGLSVVPALWGAAVVALAAIAVAALAMSASLWLPRLACFVLVLLAVGAVTGANLAASLGGELGPFWGAVDRFAPPIGTALALVATTWTGHPLDASPFEVSARLALWAAFAPALLATLFRRVELAD